MKHCLFILVFGITLLNIPCLIAGPGNSTPFEYIQPDQSCVILKVFGDEWYNYVTTVDGFTVIKNEHGFWVYAQKNSSGELIPSDVIAHSQAERSSGELGFLANINKNLQPNQEIINKRKCKNPYRFAKPNNLSKVIKSSNSAEPVVWRIPVILVEFPDLSRRDSVESVSIQKFDDMFNMDGWEGGIGATGSFNDYYREVSYGKFEIVADILGWYMADKNLEYYSWSGSDCWPRAREFTANAIDSAEADGVDFSVYDNDGDGYVEQVIIVHAGHGAAQNGDLQYIWPHKWNLGGLERTYDGVTMYDYTIQEELQYGRQSGIGMYCHEFGHALGLPDLYDYDGSSEGVGNWCLMAGGSWLNSGRTPPHFCAWCKEELGWIIPIEITESKNFIFEEVETNDSVTYKINITTDDSEYFLVENRQRILSDTYLANGGLLIWHIDTDVSSNDVESHKQVDLEEADGLNDLDFGRNRGDSGDPYPGSKNNRIFDTYSYPNSLDYNENLTMVSISNISDSDLIMNADVSIGGQALFSTELRTGHAPLTVTFNDRSLAFDPITAWKWDFDSDGNFDSEDQNPEWTFTEPGIYSVTLEVSNDNVTTSTTRNNYIKVFNGESALLFDDVGQFAMIPENEDMNPMAGVTLEAWIKPTDWGPDQNGLARVFDKGNFYIYLQKTFMNPFLSNSMVFVLKDENNKKSRWGTPENSIVLDEWQHIAVTYNSELMEIKIYINGVEQALVNNGTVTGPIKNNSTKEFYMGNSSSYTRTYQGTMDEVRLWDYARSATDIDTTMNSYSRGTEDGLLGYWKMNEGNGDEVFDRTNNNLDGSVQSSWTNGIVLTKPTTVENDYNMQIPQKYELFANYPNPFNPETKIKFALQSDAEVTIKIFNVLGQLIDIAMHQKLSAGYHYLTYNATNISSGIYFYVMEAKGSDGSQYINTRKMVIIK